jgi:hypothetical protein
MISAELCATTLVSWDHGIIHNSVPKCKTWGCYSEAAPKEPMDLEVGAMESMKKPVESTKTLVELTEKEADPVGSKSATPTLNFLESRRTRGLSRR